MQTVPLLLATTDTLPQPYAVIGLVTAAAHVSPMSLKRGDLNALATNAVMADLTRNAQSMGAHGVIGIRFNLAMAGQILASGTAIRFL